MSRLKRSISLIVFSIVLFFVWLYSHVFVLVNCQSIQNNIKISVVVPIYKVEKYIRECLDSIKNQTLKDIEIICIDDGTPDKSGQIADEYAQEDSRFIVIHQENHGLPAARNRGIEKATGEYIMFVDSDDSINSEACEICYNKATEHNADILLFNTKEQIIDHPIFNNIKAVVWSGIYKTSFLKENKILFNERVKAYGEDQSFNMICNAVANKIVCISNKLYNYRTNNLSSLTHAPLHYQDNHIDNIKFVYEYFKEHEIFEKHEDAASGLLKLLCDMNYWKNNPNISRKFINAIGPEILTDKNISKLDKSCQRYINRFFARSKSLVSEISNNNSLLQNQTTTPNQVF